MPEREPRPEEQAHRQAELRRRYRRRRATALVVVAAGLVAVGALLAGFVFGGTAGNATDALGTSTICEPIEPPTTVKPRWWTARRQTGAHRSKAVLCFLSGLAYATQGASPMDNWRAAMVCSR